jgi:hypothetical protein
MSFCCVLMKKIQITRNLNTLPRDYVVCCAIYLAMSLNEHSGTPTLNKNRNLYSLPMIPILQQSPTGTAIVPLHLVAAKAFSHI